MIYLIFYSLGRIYLPLIFLLLALFFICRLGRKEFLLFALGCFVFSVGMIWNPQLFPWLIIILLASLYPLFFRYSWIKILSLVFSFLFISSSWLIGLYFTIYVPSRSYANLLVQDRVYVVQEDLYHSIPNYYSNIRVVRYNRKSLFPEKIITYDRVNLYELHDEEESESFLSQPLSQERLERLEAYKAERSRR